MKSYQKDHFVFGLGLGILIPMLVFGLIFLFNYILILIGVAEFYLDFNTQLLVSFFANLLPLRYYFVSLSFEKTGRGILLITFALIILFFIFKNSLELNL